MLPSTVDPSTVNAIAAAISGVMDDGVVVVRAGSPGGRSARPPKKAIQAVTRRGEQVRSGHLAQTAPSARVTPAARMSSPPAHDALMWPPWPTITTTTPQNEISRDKSA